MKVMYFFSVLLALAMVAGCQTGDLGGKWPDSSSIIIDLKNGKTVTYPASAVSRVTYRYAGSVKTDKKSIGKSDATSDYTLLPVSSTTGEYLADVSEGRKRFRIDQNDLGSPEWRSAIERAEKHVGGRGYYTLMRVILEDSRPEEKIQAQATKLKQLTEKYYGGGGEYRVVNSGGFIFFQHINSTRRQDGRDPVTVGAPAHGRTRLWADVPSNGTLGVLGDVILRRYPIEEMGRLVTTIELPPGVKATRLVLGPVVVGGPYGNKFEIEQGGRCDTGRLAPGTYKILFPEFDMRKSRWFVNIAPRTVTHVKFVAHSQRELEKIEESYTPDVDALVPK